MPFKLSKKQSHEEFNINDHVVYIPIDKSPRSSVGVIDEILTEETLAESASPRTGEVTIHASEEEPRYVIRNLNTGKTTVYKRYNIMRKATKKEIESKRSDFSLDRDTSPHAEGPHHGVPLK